MLMFHYLAAQLFSMKYNHFLREKLEAVQLIREYRSSFKQIQLLGERDQVPVTDDRCDSSTALLIYPFVRVKWREMALSGRITSTFTKWKMFFSFPLNVIQNAVIHKMSWQVCVHYSHHRVICWCNSIWTLVRPEQSRVGTAQRGERPLSFQVGDQTLGQFYHWLFGECNP